MLPCPSCQGRLNRVMTPSGIVQVCPNCGGRSVTVPVLRRDSAGEFPKIFLSAARQSTLSSQRRCPYCAKLMRLVSVATPQGILQLDYCKLCNQVWFDRDEYRAVPPAVPAVEEELSPKAREALAVYKIKTEKEHDLPIDQEAPDSVWQYLPAILGLPVEFNETPKMRRPWLTWGLSATMAILFLLQLSAGTLRTTIEEFGFIPAEWLRQGGLTVFTSFFLHAGVLHIVTNLYFFMVFGDNVEDHLGVCWFVLLLFVSHLAGLVVHSLGDPRGDIPLVGASGGIAGVLAYYALVFPRAKLGFMLRYWCVFRWVRISAVWALVLFVGIQLLGAWRQSLGMTGVSSFGHLGGLAVGLIAGLFARARRTQPSDEKIAE